eukprot:CAMPEP_0115148284 /NCGR_PEP_ID=MMETSP0227-20121206/63785_1 /TAXON_ID=89957 /ORGANISM="Polarella glacialis, Strain CCMP 1383" /LENGTH=50 /DNA_ID=CAMNT_0002558295 /DNA_START=76 /DNA_END=224 /DNA_ORIENTATION=-
MVEDGAKSSVRFGDTDMGESDSQTPAVNVPSSELSAQLLQELDVFSPPLP